MCLIDNNLVGLIIDDLNKEIFYKINEHTKTNIDIELLTFITDGKVHRIFFLGQCIWDCEIEKMFENIPEEKNMEFNEDRAKLESHLRNLIMDQINIFKTLEV